MKLSSPAGYRSIHRLQQLRHSNYKLWWVKSAKRRNALGDFVGAERTYLGIGGDSYPGQTFIFTDTSQIQVPIILVIDSVVVNIAGDFTPGMVSLTPYESYLDIKSGTTFNLTTTSVIMPYKVSFTSATLNLPDTPLDIFELVGMGTLYNPAHLKIMKSLS